MRNTVEEAAEALCACFRAGGKLLLCGNGGSAADCAHIAGELCKGFLLRRAPGEGFASAVGEPWAAELQLGLPAVDLTANSALLCAIVNDIGGECVFAQQVLAYGRAGDTLLCLSTSGNAENVRRAALTAKALGLRTVALTGAGGGRLASLCDLLLDADGKETAAVQETQIRLYHRLCALVERELFGQDGG